jgi:hypothetical protein
MPTYEFRNVETGEIVERVMRMSEYDDFVKNNPHLERFFSAAPPIGDPIRLGLKKPDDAFRDRLKDIKSTHYKSKINTF